MNATLCAPNGATTVVVLVPGVTYNQAYWDFPYQPDTYNFRQALNESGYATLTVDRLGSGKSTRLPSGSVNASAHAAALHKVIDRLRSGSLGGTGFSSVVLGGHSMGSAVAMLEASTYRDVDAVLVTGFVHLSTDQALSIPPISPAIAAFDPALTRYFPDLGYLTTAPGTRQEAFHAPGVTDPEVVRVDESTKGVMTLGEALDGAAALVSPSSRAIDVPVLVTVGRNDTVACGGDCGTASQVQARESQWFGGPVEAYVLEGAGHAMNLTVGTGAYQAAVVDWLSRTVG